MRPTGLNPFSEELLPMKITILLFHQRIFVNLVDVNRSLLFDSGLKQVESNG